MTYAVVTLSKNPGNLQAFYRATLLDGQALVGVPPYLGVYVVDDGAQLACSRLPVTWCAGVKPFVFARNANIGLRAAFEDGADVAILANDDALLETPHGFEYLAIMSLTQGYGLVSAAVRGAIGNQWQAPRGSGDGPFVIRDETETLAFVCVAIPRSTWNFLGPLDERFVTYGWEDNDYCRRARVAGFKNGVYDGCVVEHGSLPSTFRAGNGGGDIEPGRKIFEDKWQS